MCHTDVTRNAIVINFARFNRTEIFLESFASTSGHNFFRTRASSRIEFRRQCEGNDSVTRGISIRAISIVNSAGLAIITITMITMRTVMAEAGTVTTTQRGTIVRPRRRFDIEHELARTIENRGDIETTVTLCCLDTRGVSRHHRMSDLRFGSPWPIRDKFFRGENAE